MRASSLLLGLAALPATALANLSLGSPGTGLILLTEANQLVSLTDSAPTLSSPPVAISGINANDTLVAIDVRPINQQLYGLGVNTTNDTIQLYCISALNGFATPVGAANGMVDGAAVKIQLDATRYGIDFNPASDRLRVVNSSGVNFRVNPNTGACVDSDAGTNGINPDGPIAGLTTSVGEAAYTNNVPENGNITTLYTIDPSTDSLYIQNPPNNGFQTSAVGIKVGGIPLNFTAACGFDIPVGVNAASPNLPATGSGYAVLESGTRRLYRINLGTGEATQLSIPAGITIRSMAVATQVPTAIGLTATANLVRFRRNSPTTTTTQALNLAALAANETLVGIDYRPATGQLYGLAVNSTNNSASLYLIEPGSGAVSLAVAGTQGMIKFVDGTGADVLMPPATDGYGMDFNPTVDRLRVTCGNAGGAGINFRVNPNTGLGATANPDVAINGAGTGATACAYTNSFGQSLSGGTTTLYALDPATDSLCIVNPPNAGTLTSPKPVSLNGATLDFTAASGFDITQEGATNLVSAVASPGDGWAVLTVGGLTKLYRINLRTGEATAAGNIGAGATVMVGLAVAGEAGLGYAPFSWDSTSGTPYRIETSTDLQNWQPYGRVTTTGTTTTVPVPWYEGEFRRFWRAVP
ncbi:DUF4394 domain-containing protein [Haloferula sp. BvORR071]|uniref:DUF4394 domain-containing protein n=1 Tax=Haloferula sp. BvORR071 TaxID=1396141 RepID=UPI00054E17BB|nr:DUF4394 domain-containing protein [Haloferula sp. BvORR071]